MSRKIQIDKITLHYRCDECDAIAEQPLEEITTVGTAICPICGRDMELDEFATIITENNTTVEEMLEAAMEVIDHLGRANWSGRQQAAQRWLKRILNDQRDLSLNEIQDVVNKEWKVTY